MLGSAERDRRLCPTHGKYVTVAYLSRERVGAVIAGKECALARLNSVAKTTDS